MRWSLRAGSRRSSSPLDPIVRSMKRVLPTTSGIVSPTCSRSYREPRKRSWIRYSEIPGVAAAEARIAKLALLDIPNYLEPATAQVISLPDIGESKLNRLYMRLGRVPEAGRSDEIVVNDTFAKAHGFVIGSRFSAILNGRKRDLVIVGTALSPEFIFTIGPGDIMPDDRRFAIIWMSEKALAGAYNLDGAFSSISVKLLRNASEREVIARLDALLDKYGGRASYGRKDQTSHAWIDHELDMLSNMSRTLTPIFLLVSAFLVNLTLTRLVALEREQIGLLKALGYANRAIVGHYVKFVVAIVVLGVAIGSGIGTWLGVFVTQFFGDFFHFPFLVFAKSPDLYVIAAVLKPACCRTRCQPCVAGGGEARPSGRNAAACSSPLPEVAARPGWCRKAIFPTLRDDLAQCHADIPYVRHSQSLEWRPRLQF